MDTQNNIGYIGPFVRTLVIGV